MEKYSILKKLGAGGFGSVFLAERTKDKQKVAIKCILLNRVEWYEKTFKIPTEVVILLRLKKLEGVSKILDHFTFAEYYCIVMEYYSGKDLFDYIVAKKRLSLEETKIITKRLVEILIELEKKNIYHNDIKDENIMISDEGKITLIDFGSATIDGATPKGTFSGTRIYAPSEWIVNKLYNPKYATSWTIGLLLVTMLSGDTPFESDDDIVKGKYSLPIVVPDEIHALIKKCLAKNPCERPCLQEILKVLE